MEHYSLWNTIYTHFDPVAFHIFGLSVHWYGIAYVCALVLAFFIARFFLSANPARFSLAKPLLDSYFLWAEAGVLLGARIGYALIYDPDRFYYLANPLDIFNPFDQAGEFVGIRGMSFHGGVLGFLLASYLFTRVKRIALLPLLDLVAVSVPLAYIFGRIGNFLNQELYGRVVDANDSFGQAIGILVQGTLRYPSQLLEALLEGGVVFLVVWFCARIRLLRNALIGIYAIAYGLTRFVAEYWREPDAQLGLFGSLSMGQILCLIMVALGGGLTLYVLRQNYKEIPHGTRI